MADSDIIERLEKQIEGSNLALAAVAEVLHKMDSRLTKAEDDEFELSQEEEDQFEKQEIIKAVAGEVYGLIKADNPDNMGQWGEGGDYTVSVQGSSGKSGTISGGADDSSKATNTDSKTEHAKRTFQAMQKQLNLLKEQLGMDDDDLEKAGYGMAKEDPPMDDDEEETEEEKKKREEEEAGEEEGGSGGFPVQEMAKSIAQIQKMVSSKSKNIQKMVQNETEERLRKMGFREENGLNSPRLIRYDDALGVDNTSPIRKAASADETVDQMMQLSYGELRRLQEQIESGETSGIPRELLEGF